MKNHTKAIAITLLALTAACASNSRSKRTEHGPWQWKIGGYVGNSEIEDSVGDKVDGTEVGGRMEISYAAPKTGQRLAVGARVGGGSRKLEENLGQGVRIEVDSIEFDADLFVRGYFLDNKSKVRPFFEFFGGYSESDADITGTVGSLSATTSENINGFGWGGGLGLEVQMERGFTATVGAEVRKSEFDSDLFGDVDELQIGGYVLFGVTW